MFTGKQPGYDFKFLGTSVSLVSFEALASFEATVHHISVFRQVSSPAKP